MFVVCSLVSEVKMLLNGIGRYNLKINPVCSTISYSPIQKCHFCKTCS